MSKIDLKSRLLAEEIGLSIATHLLKKLRSGDMPLVAEYLTPLQVAQLTGFTSKALESMRARRAGPPFLKIGTAVRYRVSDVRAWIETEGKL